MVYIGKRNYKSTDCTIATACKKNFGLCRGETCDSFAQMYCNYINNGGAAAALLEVCLDIEKQIIKQVNNSDGKADFYKYLYNTIKYCISLKDINGIDYAMLHYLSTINLVCKSFDISYDFLMMPYEQN